MKYIIHKMAIEVLKILNNNYNNYEVNHGRSDKDGSLKECLELSTKYKLNQKIEFVGYSKKLEWIEIAKDHDVFINTSTIDNMPVSILEMMALGLPIISTNVGGIPLFLKNRKNSFLVAFNDSKKMASQVEYLINKPSCAQNFIECIK